MKSNFENESQNPPPAYTISLPPSQTPQTPSAPPATQPIPTSELVGELLGRGLNAGFKAAKTAATVGSKIISGTSRPTPSSVASQQPVPLHPPSQQYNQQSGIAYNSPTLVQQSNPAPHHHQNNYQMGLPSSNIQPAVYQQQNGYVQQSGVPQGYLGVNQPQIYPLTQQEPAFPSGPRQLSSRPPARPLRVSKSFWAPVNRASAWKAVLYYLLINPVLGLFTFGYTLATMVAGLVLLIIYPIGLPLLYVFAITWRLLRKMDLHILDWVVGLSFQETTIWIDSKTTSDNPFEFMGEMVWSHTTWDIVWASILYKPFKVIINMFIAILTVSLGIPFVWCLPSLLLILEDAAEGERVRSGRISSSLCCCCCCYNETGSVDAEYGTRQFSQYPSQSGYQNTRTSQQTLACNLM